MTDVPADFSRLVDLVGRLRAPDGCPWDREQTLGSLRSHLLEEAHEVAAGIDAGDWDALAGELGDLLFQVAFLTRLGEESGRLTRDAVVAAVEAKMIARHPHVFGQERAADAGAVERAWERRKAEEGTAAGRSHLSGVAASLPALAAAAKLTRKAAGVGFDWPGPEAVLAKVEEELAELARDRGDRERAAEELGDVLFTLASLARHLDVDPEAALARANRKFRRRFAAMEARLAAAGRPLATADPDELEATWEAVKAAERDGDA
jgi:MazG family protein